MSKFQQLFTNTIIFAIGNVLTKLILFLLMPLYTTSLTTEQYGIADLLTNSIELILPIMTLCISDAVFRLSIDIDIDKKSLLSNGLYILIRGNIIFILIILIFSLLFPNELWFYFYILYLSNSVRQLMAQFTRGIGLVKEFALSGIISAIALVISNIILLLGLNGGVKSYLIAIIISNISSIIYLVRTGKLTDYIEKKSVNKKLLKDMLKFSIPNIPNMLSWWINNVSSRYIISMICGANIAGMFAAASKIPSLINVLSSIFQQAWQYSSSKEYVENENSSFYNDVFQYYSGFILIASSSLLMIIPYISKYVLLGEFYEGWRYIPLLLVSATIGCYSSFFGTFYLVVKKNTVGMISTIVGASINLAICIVTIPTIGVYGALIASIFSYSVITYIRIITTRKYVSIEVNMKKLTICICILLFQSILLVLDIKYKSIGIILLYIGNVSINIKTLYTPIKQMIRKLISI